MAAECTSTVRWSEKKKKQSDLWGHLCIRCADSQAACLYSDKVHSHIVHQPSRHSLSDVSEGSRAFLSVRSVPGEHVRWNSPPIKTGISWVHCGNRPECGKAESLSLSPSLSDTQPHSHSLLLIKLPPSHLSHPYCNCSSTLLSPFILFFFTVFLTLFLFTPLKVYLTNIFYCFLSHL